MRGGLPGEDMRHLDNKPTACLHASAVHHVEESVHLIVIVSVSPVSGGDALIVLLSAVVSLLSVRLHVSVCPASVP